MRVLITGSTGVVGQQVVRAFADLGVQVVPVTRNPARPGEIAWNLGVGPAPESVRGPWDVVVHTAASTRWSMDRDEAVAANVRPMEAILNLVDQRTHLVHVSTAYADGVDSDEKATTSWPGRYRNGYEWSKAECERLARERHPGPLTVIRPPLIVGSRTDGSIGRFTGPYTLVQTVVSGLAAAIVGDPLGYAEIAPVDQVADVIVSAAVGTPPTSVRTETVTGGGKCLRLGELLDIVCGTLNQWRGERGLDPITPPPFIASRRWHRFFLPLAERHLSEVQLQVVQLLGMFESYTSLDRPFEPTQQVEDPAETLARSVRWWADRKPRLASRTPEPWRMIVD
ncbi:SDR family oxidoreductase [Micromonospora sp. NPDC049523]|uniref:SDR family oxidoreductase n=1 Tax=Micromonospora sp. NPDC049523 TaxID=3155921 RepID=UPI003413E7E5